jgi:hypothetical protein
MERGKLEEYKDAPGVALLNAFNNGHLTRDEYQVIQKFKKEPWDDIDEFLKNIAEEGTKTVESTETVESAKRVPSKGTKTVESTKIVDSTKTESSIIEDSITAESTKTAPSLIRARRVLGTVSDEASAAVPMGLFNVNIKANFTMVDNDVYTRLKPIQTTLEYSIYDTLYHQAIRWNRNYCRIGRQKLMECCNIADKRRLNRGIDGLAAKKHIQIINRNSSGTLYRVFFPQEVLNITTKTVLEMIPVDHEEDTNGGEEGTEKEESTKTVESTKKPPIIDPIDLSIDLSPDSIVDLFYTGIGQERISKAKREKGNKVVQELLADRFSLEDIAFAAEWTPKNAKEEVYDIAILKHTIGEAISAKREETVAAEQARKEADRVRAVEEEQRRLEGEIQEMRSRMTEDELANLRVRAEKEIRESGEYQEQFITDMLITSKENEILRSKMGEYKG